ncbi:MAG: hypothetical protein WCY00_00630 [Candidatus Dojkabacteria bacterium]
MIRRLNDYLNISNKELARYGAFNSFLGIDTKVFLDPLLLGNLNTPEFSASRDRIREYYRKIIVLLNASKEEGDVAWIEAFKRLKVKEIKGFSIGYGNHSDDGNGIGSKLAEAIVRRAKEIVDMGIEDPEIFELIGLFEEGIGADRLSDLTIKIVHKDLLAYSARITQEIGFSNLIAVKYKENKYFLPRNPLGTKPIYFLPQNALRDLPIALDWDEIEIVTNFNIELRKKVNQAVSEVWQKSVKEKKKKMMQVIRQDPEILKSMIEAYKHSKGKGYDFENDPNVEIKWLSIGQKIAKENPIKISASKKYTKKSVCKILDQIIKQYKKLIEFNGLNNELYRKEGSKLIPHHERVAQRIFFAIADTYCAANNIGINREPNAGSGSVDFKFGIGYEDKILVEIKLSKNPGLKNKYRSQVDIYMKAEGTEESIYLVIKVTEKSKQLEELIEIDEEAKNLGQKVPKLYVIDGTIKPSASKR